MVSKSQTQTKANGFSDIWAIILAAGQSRRFQTRLPKVFHGLAGRPLYAYPLQAALEAGVNRMTFVVGPEAYQKLKAEAPDSHEARFSPPGLDVFLASESLGQSVFFALQETPRGTADAVRCGWNTIQAKGGEPRYVLVLNGDVPLLRSETIRALIEKTRTASATMGLVTVAVDQPKGYGRVIWAQQGDPWVTRIIEESDASPEERAVTEINVGAYCIEARFLENALGALKTENKQKEFYLTDLVAMSWAFDGKQTGGCVALRVKDGREAMGVNDRRQLAEAAEALRARLVDQWMSAGVTFEQPLTVVIGPEVKLARDCTIGPNVKLLGKTTLAEGVTIEGSALIRDTRIGSETQILWGSVLDQAVVGNRCHVGPYARLRPESVLKDDVRVGNFVELKKTTLGERTKANHLSYLGDATVGADVNVGCGFITCNYDGDEKHPTVIEDGVFIGSDSQVVAPVTLGAKSYVAAGTTVTANVPSGGLVLSRVKQTIKPDYVAQRARKIRGSRKK